MNNECCFLADPSWNSVFLSLINEESLITDRSKIAIQFSTILAHMSILFKDITDFICHPVDAISVPATLLASRAE
jgi:hypothetical protein